MDLEIRAATPDEIKFIRNSWFRSMKQHSDLGRLIRPDLFSQGANELIDKLTTLWLPVVACLPAVPEEVLGWACRSVPAVHYVYVKHDFRRQGVATRLAFGAQFYTIRTKGGEEFFKRIGALYNPFQIWKPT